MEDISRDDKISPVAKNSAIMSIAVFCSRILGLVRDQVMAAFFGTTFVNDAFNIAFNIPNLLRRLFGEGALSAAFVPIYNEFGIKKGKQFQINFALNVLAILSFILLLLSALGMVFAPLIVKAIYHGAEPQTSELAIKLCRIIFPYLFFIGLSSTMIAILNSHNKFFITGLSSGLLNIGWIAMVLVGAVVCGRFAGLNSLAPPALAGGGWAGASVSLIYWAAYGVLLGGLLQTIINLPFLKQIGYFRGGGRKDTPPLPPPAKAGEAIETPNTEHRTPKTENQTPTTALKTLWYRFIPGMIGLGIREINLIADALIASFLPVGSISALNFGNRLMQLPLGIFGISVGTAVLPEYSRAYTEKRWSDISETLKFSMHYILYILVPISVIMIMGSELFIRLIFERGAFGEEAVAMTRLAVIFYVAGLCFYGLNQVVTPLFYAAKDTKTPVKIAACMVALNITLNLILMQFMAHAGLALSTSITALVQFVILIILIKRKLPEIKFTGYKKNIWKLAYIITFLTVLLFLFNHIVVFDTPTLLLKIAKTTLFLTLAMLTLITLFQTTKPQYFQEIVNKVVKRFKK